MQRDLTRIPQKGNASKVNYGYCNERNKPVSFIPAICQLETQYCFIHRKDLQNDRQTESTTR